MIDPYEFNDANAQGDKEAVILPNLPSLVNKLSADETNGIKDKINEIAQVVNVIDPDNANLQTVTNSGNITDKEMIIVSDGLVPDDVFNQAVFSNKSFKAINTDTNNSITVLSDKIQSVKTDGGFESTINVSNAEPTETATYEQVKPNKSGTYAMTDDVGVATLQQATAGANKNLVDGIFQAGEGAGNGQTGVNVNQFGGEAGAGNIGDNQNALGVGAGVNNTGDNQNALGVGAGIGNTGDFQNAFGQGAGIGNTGNHQNAFGVDAGQNNTKQGQNAFGQQAGKNNTGDFQNAFGQGAGFGNIYDDVNLFGQETQADENGQTVFRSSGGFMTRLSTLLLTASRKYIFPDKSGTFAMLDDIILPIPYQSIVNLGDVTGAVSINWNLGVKHKLNLTGNITITQLNFADYEGQKVQELEITSSDPAHTITWVSVNPADFTDAIDFNEPFRFNNVSIRLLRGSIFQSNNLVR